MRYLLASLLIFGAIVSSFGQIVIDQDLMHHFNQFKIEAEKRGVSLSIVPNRLIKCIMFSTPETDSIFWINKLRPNGDYDGVTVILNGTNDTYIFINPKAYLASDKTGRELTVFHEFFHAFFDMPHDDNNVMMKPNIGNSDAWFYLNNREKVLDTLFKKIKNEKGIITRSTVNSIF